MMSFAKRRYGPATRNTKQRRRLIWGRVDLRKVGKIPRFSIFRKTKALRRKSDFVDYLYNRMYSYDHALTIARLDILSIGDSDWRLLVFHFDRADPVKSRRLISSDLAFFSTTGISDPATTNYFMDAVDFVKSVKHYRLQSDSQEIQDLRMVSKTAVNMMMERLRLLQKS